MNVTIIGAGEVGTHIATILSELGHSVVVIDKNPQKVERIEEMLDVQTVVGHGSNISVLESAGTPTADLLLAVSDSDELNLSASLLAKQLGARQTVVRARKAFYIEDRLREYISAFRVDRVICPEILTAQEIAKRLEHPGTERIEFFAHGRIQLRTMQVAERSRWVGVRLRAIPLPGRTLIAGIHRPVAPPTPTKTGRNGKNGKNGVKMRLIIPSGDDRIEQGDKLTVVGSTSDMARIEEMFTLKPERIHRAVVMGGGIIGSYLTRILSRHHVAVTLVERDPVLARRLAKEIPRVEVLQGDATVLPFLEENRLGDTEVFAATTSHDDSNLMACLLMSEFGVKRTAAVMHRPDFASLVERLGVTYALSPRYLVGDTVISMLQQRNVLAVTMLAEGEGEAIEFRVTPDTPLAGKKLKDARLPRETLIGAIVRQGDVIVPKGDDRIEAGDTVVVCMRKGAVARVEALFRDGL